MWLGRDQPNFLGVLPPDSRCVPLVVSCPAAESLGLVDSSASSLHRCAVLFPARSTSCGCQTHLQSSPTLIVARITGRSHSQIPLQLGAFSLTMCLVKVKQEEDVVVPYRVVQRSHSPPRRRASHASARRYSRTTEIVRESPRPSASYVAVPTPKPLQIPAPQPVPVFVEPPPAPMPVPMPPAPPPPPSHISSQHTSHHGGAHYVEVSPRSSVTSQSSSSAGRSEYVYRERQVRRERQYSPDRAPRYEHFRYVEPAPSESEYYQRRERSRQRSRSRGGYEDSRGSYRETNTRVTLVDGDGGRRREYRR